MSIICEHVHGLELRKSFKFRVAVRGKVASVPKTLINRNYQYSCTSYFGHACLKLNLVLLSLLTGKCATQNFKNLHDSSLWTN